MLTAGGRLCQVCGFDRWSSPRSSPPTGYDRKPNVPRPVRSDPSYRLPSRTRRHGGPRMETVTSGDGTTIGFDRLGSGPPVVLVCGASVTRGTHAGLAELLAPDLMVLNYDRRGRGDSGDTPPYAIEREVEDLGAVIEVAGGSAGVWG